MRSTDDPDDDSQQGPEHTDARPRADSGAVARCSECRPRADRSAVARLYVADFKPASLRENESVKSSKDRQPRKRCQTCLKHESGKRARKLHRGKPADSEVQSQVNKDGRIQQKDCAQQQAKERVDGSAFSRETDRHNSKAYELQPSCNAREKVMSTREGK